MRKDKDKTQFCFHTGTSICGPDVSQLEEEGDTHRDQHLQTKHLEAGGGTHTHTETSICKLDVSQMDTGTSICRLDVSQLGETHTGTSICRLDVSQLERVDTHRVPESADEVPRS